MPLEIGSEDANSGMSQAIYEQIDYYLSPTLEEAVDNAAEDAKDAAQEALDAAREGWKKLSYAIAKGVIEHVKENMEIHDIETEGEVDGNPAVFTQVSGTGRVE